MKTWTLPAVLLAATLGLAGCENRSDTPPPATPTPVDEAATEPDRLDIDVDVDTDDATVSERAERRQERRENLRDTIDNIDVNVGEQGVDVNVD